jgi:hypothetical protein
MNPQGPAAPIMNNFPKGGAKKIWLYVAGGVLIVLIGVGTAWLIAGRPMGGGVSPATTKVSATEAGTLDPSVKYDTATGILQTGGIDNEGTFHLVRDGGTSKYVYLTSSVIDLNNFLNKNVQVWGETLASKHAGWLMDVAKVQVTP